MIGVPFERRETVRLGFIGAGLRGRSLLGEFVNVPGVKVVAVCDVVREKAEMAKAVVEKAGQPAPAIYVDGDQGYGIYETDVGCVSLTCWIEELILLEHAMHVRFRDAGPFVLLAYSYFAIVHEQSVGVGFARTMADPPDVDPICMS